MMQQFELHLIFRQDTIFCYLNDSQNNLQALGFLAPKCKHNKKRIFASLNDNPLKRQAQNIFANQLMIFTIHFCYFDSAQQPKANLRTCSYWLDWKFKSVPWKSNTDNRITVTCYIWALRGKSLLYGVTSCIITFSYQGSLSLLYRTVEVGAFKQERKQMFSKEGGCFAAARCGSRAKPAGGQKNRLAPLRGCKASQHCVRNHYLHRIPIGQL